MRVIKPGGRLVFTDQVPTGPISAAELAVRSTTSSAMNIPSGYNERLLGDVGFQLLRWKDMSATTAEIAERHCAARKAHADALRASEGDVVFEEQIDTAPLWGGSRANVAFHTWRSSPGSLSKPLTWLTPGL